MHDTYHYYVHSMMRVARSDFPSRRHFLLYSSGLQMSCFLFKVLTVSDFLATTSKPPRGPLNLASILFILLIWLKDHGKYIAICRQKEEVGWSSKSAMTFCQKKISCAAGKITKWALAILTVSFG